MTQELRYKLLFIIIFGLVCIYIAIPPQLVDKPLFKKGQPLEKLSIDLGIDLQGGAELTYRVLADKNDPKISEITDRTREVLERRVNIRGLKEPRINKHGSDEIVVQLPGIDSDKVKEYKELFKQTGQLDLKEVGDEEMHKNYLPKPDSPKKPAGWSLLKNTERKGEEDYIKGEYIWVKDVPVVTGKEITNATPTLGDNGRWAVNFTLNPEGGKSFMEATGRLAKKGYIAIILDGTMQSCPKVQSEISESGVITGNFDEPSANQLSTVLRSGSLPKPIGKMAADGTPKPGEPEAESFVGPTLGQDSIKRGFLSSAIATIGVILFMLIYYRKAGLVAVIALLLNGILLLAIMAVLGATLTLPGIAGIALTLAMAVDANILIYERIREEKERGRTALQAFELGFDRAFTTIVDANMTHLIAATVLYYFGTGPIQGFAVTLVLGILTTLFTTLWCSKVILRAMLATGAITEFSMMKLFSKPNIKFTAVFKLNMVLSLILFIGSLYLFFKQKETIRGSDFTGGSSITIAFNEKQSIESVREGIRKITINEKGADVPKYSDAEVQTVAPPEEGLKVATQLFADSTLFQIRTQNPNTEEIKKDLLNAFKDRLSREPFEEMPKDVLPKNVRDAYYDGDGTYVYFLKEKDFKFDELKNKIIDAVKAEVGKDAVTNAPLVSIEEVSGAPDGLEKVKLMITRADKESQKLSKIKDALKSATALKLPKDPFLNVGNIGPSVAAELKTSTIWALIWSWVLIIVYVGFRFHSFIFGTAAVIALIHDAVIAVGAIALCHLIIPQSWGLNFTINMPSLAAILSIIGYSVNDTVVVYDRIRENLRLQRKESLHNIIDISVNEMLGRTVLTSFATWISVALLYFLSLKSSSNLELLTFPLLIGIIVGTYSSIYIASPILVIWFKDKRPEIV